MSITVFKAKLKGGGSRGNQFRVSLNFPAFVTGGIDVANSAQFLCEAASLPGQQISVTQLMYRGRQVKIAGERNFDNWNITVLNDTDFSVHNAFEGWMQVINNKQENSGLINPLAYTANVSVEQLDRNGNLLKKYTFVDAWPTAISPIGLDWGQNDQVERFNVEFAYSWFQSEMFQGGAATLSTIAGNL